MKTFDASQARAFLYRRIHWTPFAGLAITVLAATAISFAMFNSGDVLDWKAKINRLAESGELWIPFRQDGMAERPALIHRLNDTSGRLTWLTFLLFQTIALASANVFFLKVLHDRRGLRQVIRDITPLAATGALLGIAIGFIPICGVGFDEKVGNGIVYGPMLLHSLVSERRLLNLPTLIGIEEFLAVAVIVLGTYAACATIAEPAKGEGHVPKSLREGVSRLRLLLTVSTTVLIFSVLQISTEYRWLVVAANRDLAARSWLAWLSSTLGKEPSLVAALSSYTSSVTLFAGGMLSLFMVMTFGASFLIMNYKIVIAAKLATKDGGSPADWRKKKKLTLSLADFYAEIGKVAGPLLAALTTSIIKF